MGRQESNWKFKPRACFFIELLSPIRIRACSNPFCLNPSLFESDPFGFFILLKTACSNPCYSNPTRPCSHPARWNCRSNQASDNKNAWRNYNLAWHTAIHGAAWIHSVRIFVFILEQRLTRVRADVNFNKISVDPGQNCYSKYIVPIARSSAKPWRRIKQNQWKT